METKLWYSVRNCGDGSVGLNLYESKELAELDEEYETAMWDEDWAESSISCISIISQEKIEIKEGVETVSSFKIKLEKELSYDSNDGSTKKILETCLIKANKLLGN